MNMEEHTAPDWGCGSDGLFAENAALKAEVERLRKENAELKSEVEFMKKKVDELLGWLEDCLKASKGKSE